MAVAINSKRGMRGSGSSGPLGNRANTTTASPPFTENKSIDRPRSFVDFCQCCRDTKSQWISLGEPDGMRRYSPYEAAQRIEKHYSSGWKTADYAVVQKAAMNETSGTAGGYIVPPEYGLQLMEVISEECFIWPRAHVWPMESDSMQVPRIDVETVQAIGTSPFYGGVLFTWGAEQAATETEPTFRQLVLRAWDLLGYIVTSNQLLMDTGPAGEATLIKMFGKAAAWQAEYAFLRGIGADGSMPLGVINAPGTLSVTRQTGATVTIKDITTMTASLLPSAWGNAVWACSPTCLTPIQQLAQYFINIELGGIHKTAKQAAGVLSTMPVFITEKLPSIGVAGDLVLFDPYRYVIGNRQEVLIDVSPHVSFKTFQTNFRVWLRLDGKPQTSKTVTLADGTTVVSPFVMLK